MVKKRLQNRIAESRLALPVTAVLSGLVWMGAGLLENRLWIQFACFCLTVYQMVELNNSNALIRVYSRMVTCSFMLLSCCANFLYPSLSGAFAMLCTVVSLSTCFRTYQDRETPGWTFYTFLILGIGSLAKVHLLFYVPLIWLLMATYLSSLSWRSLFASLLGLLTPYWFSLVWMVYANDFTPVVSHFAPLAEYMTFHDAYAELAGSPLFTVKTTVFFFTVTLFLTGAIHFLHTSYMDKIRTRMLYNCFIATSIFSIFLLLLQPQHYDLLMRIIIICTAPLIGHFLALTHTRLTNIAFISASVVALLLIALSLWSI